MNKEDYLKLKAGKRVRDFYYYYYLGLTCVNVGMVLMFNLSVPEDLSRRACVLSSGRKNLLWCNSSPIDSNQDESHSYPLPNPNHIPPVQMPLSAQQLLSLTTSVGLNVPPPPCLPVYSTSGFDVTSILARVATHSHPKVILGPVDLTCSFVVVDVRRYDRPIVYDFPSFYQLPEYEDHEVIGRNCRFLQSPDGNVRKGEERRYVAPKTVQHLYKAVVSDKECQTSIINYRKGGQAFINLVTIIPITGGAHNTPEGVNEVVYHIGFQVDLTEQPSAILRRLWDGSYIVNHGAGAPAVPSLPAPPPRERRAIISKNLQASSQVLFSSIRYPSLPVP